MLPVRWQQARASLVAEGADGVALFLWIALVNRRWTSSLNWRVAS